MNRMQRARAARPTNTEFIEIDATPRGVLSSILRPLRCITVWRRKLEMAPVGDTVGEVIVIQFERDPVHGDLRRSEEGPSL